MFRRRGEQPYRFAALATYNSERARLLPGVRAGLRGRGTSGGDAVIPDVQLTNGRSWRLLRDDDLVTTPEVAALFHISHKTLATWLRAGQIPAIKTPGGHWRIRVGDVRELFREDS